MDGGRVSNEGGRGPGGAGIKVGSRLQRRPFSDEPPHLQFHDSEVVGFREAAVVEGVAGAAAAQVQVLVHPQSKVATAKDKDKDKDLFLCIQLMCQTLNTLGFSAASSHQMVLLHKTVIQLQANFLTGRPQ